MGISQWLMLRSLQKEARRLAKEVASMYAESKERKPNASVPDIIKDMAFDKEALDRMPEKSRKRLEICCESIQGFYYMTALDVGLFKGLMNMRSL